MVWNYKREESKGFDSNVPEGDHRIRIKSAEKAQSKNSGNDMLALQFDVSGYNETLYHYIVFLKDKPEITNRMLTQFFDSFAGIPDGEFDTQKWIGKVGACRVKHDEYNGNTKSKVHYFIPADKQSGLPAWKETSGNSAAGAPSVTDPNGFMQFDPNNVGEIPF